MSKKSFEKLKHWMGEITKYSLKNALVTIAGNKSDRVDSEQVDMVEAKKYASFFLASGKEDSNITETYTGLGIR